MTSELGSMWYERKMEDFVGQNVRAQGATTQPRRREAGWSRGKSSVSATLVSKTTVQNEEISMI